MLTDGLSSLICGAINQGITSASIISCDPNFVCEAPDYIPLHLEALFRLSKSITAHEIAFGMDSKRVYAPWQCLQTIFICLYDQHGMHNPLPQSNLNPPVTPFHLVDTFMGYLQQEQFHTIDLKKKEGPGRQPPACSLLWFYFLESLVSSMPREDVVKYIWDNVVAWSIETRSNRGTGVDDCYGQAWREGASLQVICLNTLSLGSRAVLEQLVGLLLSREAHQLSNSRRCAIRGMCLSLIESAATASKQTITGLVPLFLEVIASLSAPNEIAGVSHAQALYQTQQSCTSFLKILHQKLKLHHSMIEQQPTIWEDCLVGLMKASLTPCAANFGVLPELWSSIAQVLDGPDLEETIVGLYEVLCGLATKEGVHPPRPPCGVTLLFTHCMASFLASVPRHRLDTLQFFNGAMKNLMGPKASGNVCNVPLLTFVVRIAVQSQAYICSIGLVIEAISALVNEVQGLAMNGNEDDKLPLQDQHRAAWLLTAIADGVEYLDMFSTKMAIDLNESTIKLLDIACKVAAYLLVVGQETSFCGPAARLLYMLWRQRPEDTNILATLKTLLPHFPDKRFIAHPPTAPYVAKLGPSFTDCAPIALFEALLSETSSPSLAYLGKEAYISYARVCNQDDNIIATLPKNWLSSTTGKLLPERQACLEKYLAYGMCQPPGNAGNIKIVHDLQNAPPLPSLGVTSWVNVNTSRLDTATRQFIRDCQWLSRGAQVLCESQADVTVPQLEEMMTAASKLQYLSNSLMERNRLSHLPSLFRKQDLEVIKTCRDTLNSLLSRQDSYRCHV